MYVIPVHRKSVASTVHAAVGSVSVPRTAVAPTASAAGSYARVTRDRDAVEAAVKMMCRSLRGSRIRDASATTPAFESTEHADTTAMTAKDHSYDVAIC